MFHRLAGSYDDLVAGKDYAAEARLLESIARRYRRSTGRSWLDVACGTGQHLSRLRGTFDVTGVDASRAMLRVARRRLPGVRLVVGDMRSFRMKERFDVVSCLFSAIGHLRTEADLMRAFETFARHLAPGGVAIVEPWLDPMRFRSGSLHLIAHPTASGAVVRLAYSSRRGPRSSIHYHYLVGEEGRGIQHFEEVQVGLLVAPRRLVTLMNRAGLRARFLRRGLTTGRGLLIGVKPRA